MRLLSHRGYHATSPENTIEAFAQAVRMGVDGIETDLRLTRDGQVILFHDRVVPDGREVADLSREEVAAAVDYPVPTVDEALAGFEGLLWNLEIKVPAALESALAAVQKFAGDDRKFLITSFWHNVVAEFQQRVASPQLLRRSDIQCGLLTADRPLDLRSFLGAHREERPLFQAIVWYYEIVDPKLLAEARDLGDENYVYGVKTVADHRRCLDLGLDGVITDRPEMLAEARLEREQAGSG